MKNKKILHRIFKVLSILSILIIHIPQKKVSFPYGIALIITFVDSLSKLDFQFDLFLSFSFVLSIFMIFNKKKLLLTIGYSLMLIPFIIACFYGQYDGFFLLFWIPLTTLLLSVIMVIITVKK